MYAHQKPLTRACMGGLSGGALSSCMRSAATELPQLPYGAMLRSYLMAESIAARWWVRAILPFASFVKV